MNLKIEMRIVPSSEKGKAVFPAYMGREVTLILPPTKAATNIAASIGRYVKAVADMLANCDEDTVINHLLATRGADIDMVSGHIETALKKQSEPKLSK